MEDDPLKFTLWRALRERWRVERPRGVWRAARAIAGDLVYWLRESTPERRRARYGDIEFDWDFRVETTAANLTSDTRLRAAVAGGQYQPIQPAEFRASMEALAAAWGGAQFRAFTFLDLGSGKGRALLLASDYPFRRIIGVELLPELHAIAVENIRKYKSDAQQCREIEAVCGDAREYEFPLEPLVVYIFNPFPEPVLEEVLERLEAFVAERPREVWVVYHNPVLERVLAGKSFLEKIAASAQWVIYRARKLSALGYRPSNE